MTIERNFLLEKLKDHLCDKMSSEDIYAWALKQIMAPNYDKLIEEDDLFKETVQALMNVQNEDENLRPTRDELEYYRRCLDGEAEFKSIAASREKKPKRPRKPKDEAVEKKKKSDFLLVLRVYISLFAVSSIAVNIFGIIKPDFASIGDSSASRVYIALEAMPHLIYAALLLMPFRILAGGTQFFVSFFVFVLGVIYYWSATILIIQKLALHVLFAFIIAPFCAIPAVLALVLLFDARRIFIQSQS